ncbi:MAG TPA: LCP family protein [Phototrophicaceae bacterium]|jgi:LCP family protein required for cell wall assembly|nr:LCP family protein [Phototrophicaceae bacterium]
MSRIKAIFALMLMLLAVSFGVGVQVVSAQPTVDGSIADPMPAVELPADNDITMFLLFGTATDNPNNPGLTDMLMLVAVNRTTNSISLLSIPRDLYVYIPGHDMKKINTAYYFGETEGYEGGGIALLKEVIHYNLGVDIDYYAHVNFTGFLNIIDTLGGIDIAVDCTIRDWKLKERDLNKLEADNYEMFMLPTGLHHIDADVALWYVRSRKTSLEMDRGRRQQDVLRAVWRAIRQEDLLSDLPTLWNQATSYIDTNLTLTDVLGFMPLASAIDVDHVNAYRFKLGKEVSNAFSPAPEQAWILVPDRDAVHALLQQFVTPPTPNQIQRTGLRIEIVNASGFDNLEWVAADRLRQEGFSPVIVQEATRYRNYTSIYDYTGVTKGSPIPDLEKVLRVTDDGIVSEPDANRTADYRIYLGSSYLFWSCTRDVIQPKLKIDENGNLVVDDSTTQDSPIIETPQP